MTGVGRHLEGREEMQGSRTGSITLRWQRQVKNNHSWDCEVYSVAAALMAGLIKWVEALNLFLRARSFLRYRAPPPRQQLCLLRILRIRSWSEN